MVGKYQISDREEEFVDSGGGKDYAMQNNRPVATTYRLPMESILDLPNKFVGAKKCGECHGAGAHLPGARGAGMPSNCERCHQRFAWNADEAKRDPKRPFGPYFKSRCPSCGTEGAQSYYSVHKQKGMGCGTCHDPHEVTANDWKDRYTVPGLRKQCQDCHASQAAFFVKNNIHGSNRCTSCHMPVMMSCENFGSIQFPDYAGFDTQRRSWLIRPRTLSRR